MVKKIKDEGIGEKALVVVNQSRELIITTKEDYLQADGILSGLNEMRKSLDKLYDGVIESAKENLKNARATKARYYDPVDTEYKLLKARMGEFKIKAEREKRAEEERLTQQAIEKAEEGEPIAPVVLPNLEKTDTVFRTIWSAEVVDFDELLKAVYEGTAPKSCIVPNDKYLGERARSDKGEFNIAGCRAYSRLC